jgi:hypothetical protein
VRGGLLVGLVLLVWSPGLPCAADGPQRSAAPFDRGVRTAAQPDGATPYLGAMPSATGEPTLSPTPLSLDSKENLSPTALKLSSRLRLLADWATMGTMPADERDQARQLGLAESGAGGLSRDAAGNPVVDVRVLDTSEETIAALTALPADVLSIAPEYATVTLAIAPGRLNDLASMAAVQYVSEVIRPETNSSGGVSGGGIAPRVP